MLLKIQWGRCVIFMAVFLFALYIRKHFMNAPDMLDNSQKDFNKRTVTDVGIKSAAKMGNIDTKAENKTGWIILVTINSGFMDFFLNWFIAFKRLNLTCPVFVVTEDDGAYNALKGYENNRLQIMRSEDIALNEASNFSTGPFIQFVNRRPKHILKHLLLGYNVLFADIDSVWLKNPFPYFDGNFDVSLANTELRHVFNAGLIVLRCSYKTQTLVHMWDIQVHREPEINDQKSLNLVLDILTNYINIQELDSRNFPTGCLLFGISKEKIFIPEAVVIVHNNCRTGHKAKRQRFIDYGLWYLETGTENSTLHTDVFDQILT